MEGLFFDALRLDVQKSVRSYAAPKARNDVELSWQLTKESAETRLSSFNMECNIPCHSG